MNRIGGCFFITGLLVTSHLAHAETLRARADLWCPFNCKPGSPQGDGILVELLREVFPKNEFQIDYDIMPWALAMSDVRKGRFNAAIGISEADREGFVYTDRPQVISITCAYAKKGSKISLKKASDLSKFKAIGYSKDYSYGPITDAVLNDLAMKNRVFPIGGEHPLDVNIRKLQDSKIDVLLEDENVMDYKISSMKLRNIESVGCTEDRIKLWIGFTSPSIDPRSKSWVERLSKKQDELEQNGKLSLVYRKYGIEKKNKN